MATKVINSLTFGDTYVLTTPYATCSTAAGTAAKAATITPGSAFSLETGVRVSVKFTNALSVAAPTLNVNSSGAKAIYFRGATLSSAQYWAAGSTVDFVYDGTYWQMLGSQHNSTYSLSSFGITASATELNYTDGVTSNIQTQLNNRPTKSVTIADNADLDTIVESGFYRINSGTTNRPLDNQVGDWSQMIVCRGTDTITQIIGDYSSGHLYTRSGSPANVGGLGSWRGWHTIIDSNNIGSQSVNYANSAGAVAWGNVSSKPSYYDAKAITSISRSGTTFTATYLDGTTTTFSQQDNNTTYTFNGAVSTIKDSNLTASRALVSDANGKVAVSAVTSTELGYLDGVTSSVQTQLDGKVVKRTSNGASYTGLGTYYSGGSTPKYVKISFPTVPSWTMVTLELTIRQKYDDRYSGKLIIYANQSSGADWTISAFVDGTLTTAIKVYGSDKQHIYVEGLSSWAGLSLDRMLIGDAAMASDLTNMTLTSVDALPTTHQTATMYYGIHSGNIGSYITWKTF